jgi:hypothetical protein
MKLSVALLLALTLFTGFTNFVARSQSAAHTRNSSATDSMDRKLSYLEQNGALTHPNQAPTVLTEQEINAYLASGRVQFPAGVQSLQLQGDPGVITGKSRVDFDQVRAGHHNHNPLLSVFTGVHDVTVTAHAHGAGHEGILHVDSVSLDEVEIPHFALQLFVEKYIQPHHPEIGIDSRFNLPDKIDTATVGRRELTLTQK